MEKKKKKTTLMVVEITTKDKLMKLKIIPEEPLSRVIDRLIESFNKK